MTIGEWTAVAGLVISVLAAVYASTRVIVRSVMAELSTRRDTPRSLTS